MSAAPQEMPALAVVSDPASAPGAPPSLAQLLSHRTAAPRSRAQGRPQIVPQAYPQMAPQALRQPGLRPAAQVPAGAAAAALREPTFDELVTGCGRHRGRQQAAAPASLLRRLALRARLLPTPARRPATRATGNR